MTKIYNPEEIKNMKIGEFMEWYVSEYDGHVMPSDYSRTVAMMDGYRMAKKGAEEAVMLDSTVTLLQDAKNFFDVVLRYSGWKYRGDE